MHILILFFIMCHVHCEDVAYKGFAIDHNTELGKNIDVENYIAKYQELETTAERLYRAGVTPLDDIEKLYNDMIDILEELIEVIKDSNNAYKFLKANGLDRIVTYGLKIKYGQLKIRILNILKVLFNVIPTTIDAVISETVIDQLMKIFEEDNVVLKTLSLEILMLWLPDNPRVQAHLMKIKGLEPFYKQASLLDGNAMKLLLDLLNKILNEHLKVRKQTQRTISDLDKLKFYQRIGLIEQMSTPTVCNGLLNIFANIWSYNSQDTDAIITVFDLMKNVRQFCLKIFRGKYKAVQLFKALQEYVRGSESNEFFMVSGLNATELASDLDDYVEKLKHPVKEEL